MDWLRDTLSKAFNWSTQEKEVVTKEERLCQLETGKSLSPLPQIPQIHGGGTNSPFKKKA